MYTKRFADFWNKILHFNRPKKSVIYNRLLCLFSKGKAKAVLSISNCDYQLLIAK